MPLWIKVTIGPQFPYAKPIIQVMARVTHSLIEPGMFVYKGKAINEWNQNSNLVNLVTCVHEDFKRELPQQMAMPGQPQGHPTGPPQQMQQMNQPPQQQMPQ